MGLQGVNGTALDQKKLWFTSDQNEMMVWMRLLKIRKMFSLDLTALDYKKVQLRFDCLGLEKLEFGFDRLDEKKLLQME